MSVPATKLGKGRHGKRPADKRHPNDVKGRAIARFEELAMPTAVAAELGVPYRTAWGWRQAWLLQKHGTPSVCVCAETSTRNCPEHQNGQDAARAAVSDSDPGDEA